MALDIRRTVRDGVPAVPFERLARRILGERYELSLVVCGDHLARRLNTQYRKKTYSPNVLSFPLEKDAGEIILNVRKAAREARTYGVPFKERLAFLFVHGCLHLAGHDHGDAMDALEKRHMKVL